MSSERPTGEVSSWIEALIPSWTSLVRFQSDFIPNSHHLMALRHKMAGNGTMACVQPLLMDKPWVPRTLMPGRWSCFWCRYASTSVWFQKHLDKDKEKRQHSGTFYVPRPAPNTWLVSSHGLFAPTLEHSLHLVPWHTGGGSGQVTCLRPQAGQWRKRIGTQVGTLCQEATQSGQQPQHREGACYESTFSRAPGPGAGVMCLCARLWQGLPRCPLG